MRFLYLGQRMKLHPLIVLLFLFAINLQAQNTVGLLYNSEQAVNGYVLFSAYDNQNSYLIDNCGMVVNQWNGGATPQLTTYLDSNGHLYRSSYDVIQKHSWDGQFMWGINLTTIDAYNHHDIEILPDGNILVIISRYYSIWDAVENGRDSTTITEAGSVDGIIEIEPIGTGAANIVWEWNFKDHLVQDFDASKQNYGVVSEHPELMDINFTYDVDSGDGMSDWIHLNGVDYNSELDQILLSSRHSSEIYIIDHSTSTEEAAEHTGGNYGAGGDFLYRWGNPQIYNNGSEQDRMFWGQHDARWIEDGFEGAGMINVFNNGDQKPESRSCLNILNPPLQLDGRYTRMNGKFLPESLHWDLCSLYSSPLFYNERECGAVALFNGNVLATLNNGLFIEVDRTGNVVWSYQSPVGSLIVNQGSNGPTALFKAQKYNSNYSAFTDKDLNPSGIIENANSLSDSCVIFAGIEFLYNQAPQFIPYPNPTDNLLYFNSDTELNAQYNIYSISGELLLQSGSTPLSLNSLSSQAYILEVKSVDDNTSQYYKILKK